MLVTAIVCDPRKHALLRCMRSLQTMLLCTRAVRKLRRNDCLGAMMQVAMFKLAADNFFFSAILDKILRTTLLVLTSIVA